MNFQTESIYLADSRFVAFFPQSKAGIVVNRISKLKAGKFKISMFESFLTLNGGYLREL
jgi:hypothetical protein